MKLYAESPEKVKNARDIILEFDTAVDRQKLEKELKGKTIVEFLIESKKKYDKLSWEEIRSLCNKQNTSRI